MIVGKVVGLEFEIVSRLDRYFLMTVTKIDFNCTVFLALKQVLLILETVTRACPGLRDALFLVSKARYLSGDIKAAIR